MFSWWSRRKLEDRSDRIAAEVKAARKAEIEARQAAMRARRQQRALLSIMEGVIQDGIRPAPTRAIFAGETHEG